MRALRLEKRFVDCAMGTRVFHSVETRLAYIIQRAILSNHFLWVAVEFDPVGNHPTSNPRLIALRLCRIATGNGDEADLLEWERIRGKLRTVLLERFLARNISHEQHQVGVALITDGDIDLSVPVLFLIPEEQNRHAFALLSGDVHPGYEDTEIEYVIPNLNPKANFEVRSLDCKSLP